MQERWLQIVNRLSPVSAAILEKSRHSQQNAGIIYHLDNGPPSLIAQGRLKIRLNRAPIERDIYLIKLILDGKSNYSAVNIQSIICNQNTKIFHFIIFCLESYSITMVRLSHRIIASIIF